MSAEVAKHLQALIEWEIDRSDHDLVDATEGFDYGRRPTQPLSLEKWEFVRDALADLWAWWGDGVHLRRPVGEDDRGPVFEQTYSDELAMNAAPRDPDVQQTGMVTVRTVTLDGHLGDALFRLNVLVHFEVAKKRGWLERPEFSPGDRAADLWDGVAKMGEGPRRYQTSIKQGSKEWRVFAPYGDKPEYFEYYSNRINGVGWRRRFPSGIELKGVDLRDTVVDVGRDDITFDSCNLSAANLIAGQITASATLGVRLIVGSRALYYGRLLLRGCDLENADLSLALNTELYSYFESCNLSGAHFDFADLGRAEFRNSPTRNATFRNTILDRVIFDEISRPTDRPGPIVT